MVWTRWRGSRRAVPRRDLPADEHSLARSSVLAARWLNGCHFVRPQHVAKLDFEQAVLVHLRAAGVPAAATLGPGDVLHSEHLAARGYWQWLERAVVGNQPNPSSPFREAAADPHPVAAPAPTLGQHNVEVLGGILGLTDADLARLSASGVIGTKPRMPGTKPG